MTRKQVGVFLIKKKKSWLRYGGARGTYGRGANLVVDSPTTTFTLPKLFFSFFFLNFILKNKRKRNKEGIKIINK